MRSPVRVTFVGPLPECPQGAMSGPRRVYMNLASRLRKLPEMTCDIMACGQLVTGVLGRSLWWPRCRRHCGFPVYVVGYLSLL
jgi:hypothetical protein